MKLNFDFQIKNLQGVPFEGDNGHAGRILANVLSGLNKGNAVKLWDWSLKLWNKTELEIDETDSKVLEGFIEVNEQLLNLTKAQILQSLADQIKAQK